MNDSSQPIFVKQCDGNYFNGFNAELGEWRVNGKKVRLIRNVEAVEYELIDLCSNGAGHRFNMPLDVFTRKEKYLLVLRADSPPLFALPFFENNGHWRCRNTKITLLKIADDSGIENVLFHLFWQIYDSHKQVTSWSPFKESIGRSVWGDQSYLDQLRTLYDAAQARIDGRVIETVKQDIEMLSRENNEAIKRVENELIKQEIKLDASQLTGQQREIFHLQLNRNRLETLKTERRDLRDRRKEIDLLNDRVKENKLKKIEAKRVYYSEVDNSSDKEFIQFMHRELAFVKKLSILIERRAIEENKLTNKINETEQNLIIEIDMEINDVLSQRLDNSTSIRLIKTRKDKIKKKKNKLFNKFEQIINSEYRRATIDKIAEERLSKFKKYLASFIIAGIQRKFCTSTSPFNDLRETPNFTLKLQPLCSRSKIDSSILVSVLQWKVTLATCEGKLNNHSFIVVEGLNNGFFNDKSNRICAHWANHIIRSSTCRNTERVWPVEERALRDEEQRKVCEQKVKDGERMKFGDHFVFVAHKYYPKEVQSGLLLNDALTKFLELHQHGVVWSRDAAAMERMIKEIQKQDSREVFEKYERHPHSVLTCSEIGGENCFAWVKKIFDDAGLQLGPTIEAIGSLPRLYTVTKEINNLVDLPISALGWIRFLWRGGNEKPMKI